MATPITACTIAMDNDTTLTVPCEALNEALAITPKFAVSPATGRGIFGGTFVVTHIPTGRSVSGGSGCIECCRATGNALLATGIDWSFGYDDRYAVTDLWSEQTKRAVKKARSIAESCGAENCAHSPTNAVRSWLQAIDLAALRAQREPHERFRVFKSSGSWLVARTMTTAGAR